MVMTRMPMGARSRAMGRVIPTMPPLEAEYAAWPTCRGARSQRVETWSDQSDRKASSRSQVTCPSKAATLAVLMMQPRWPSASGSFFPISPTARRITLKVPAMFTCRNHTKGSW
ncbi:hypothetical protein EYF80_057684 [Liparis tanakae]|uniref:Uncharacterized protein n=1 Tax=Liparis tanakae TaxID=230148 RepID=A0A4Z2ETN6_9TELE|nr:hypothetical protein EYF80_057684 [Liparis tanakae]